MLPSEGATSTTTIAIIATRKRHHLTPVCCVCVCVCVCVHSSTKVIALLDASRRNAMAVRRSPVRDRDIHREWVTDWMSYRRAIIQTHIIPPIHPFSYNRRSSTLTTITIRSHPWQGDGLCRQTDRQTDIDWSLRGRVTYLLTNWAIVNHRRLPKLVKP